MVIAVPKEILEGENRVAIVPDVAARLIKSGFTVNVENNAGLNAGFTNQKYTNAGAVIVNNITELLSSADIIIKVNRPVLNSVTNNNEIEFIKPGALLISFLYPLNFPDQAGQLAAKKINAIAMDMIPRTSIAQKMDALSSQANIAGYKSVILSANHLGKIFPLLMTAAGTISPARVVIMGAGVAGLQALGTAKRLGAVVEVSDIRPSVKEEVESLGGKYIEVPAEENMQDAGGYAKEASSEFLNKQKDLIFKHVTEADIVITTALVPGKKAPVLISEEMIKNMKPGSVVLDMAVEFGGNVEISEPGKTVKKHGITIIGEPNLPGMVPYHASEMYARNILALLQHFSKEGVFNYNIKDEILKSSLIVYNGEIINERIKPLL